MLILSIETSCDETAASVTRDGREVLSNAVYTQIAMHAEYGGVVPELASRKHIEKLCAVTDSALAQAGVQRRDIDAVAVTAAPGLIGALLTGLSFAKGAALSMGVPLVPVHHIKGHIAANYIAFPGLEPPFLCTVVSGGHTLFCDVRDHDDVHILGGTRDDAAGEAFDKVARVLGFPYPGGKELDRLARSADPQKPSLKLPRPGFPEAPLECSFSGLKTAVINLVHTANQKGEDFDRAILARSICEAVTDILISRTRLAAETLGYKKIALAGGVAANSFIREGFTELAAETGAELFLPPPALCGDNAAMIGCAGYYAYLAGTRGDLTQNAFATMSPEERF
ncbi:MAG: tRNA (adenosine(37)-N6)-threonylcarbamoyltransferase complex transferase subunit TsaD [Clostridia bacterium]|nr:tRNA (adenosine(37)-N6)-threonylcarbamoyltransferase complex transferase subunit TsaD [Clostridia bacterium]